VRRQSLYSSPDRFSAEQLTPSRKCRRRRRHYRRCYRRFCFPAFAPSSRRPSLPHRRRRRSCGGPTAAAAVAAAGACARVLAVPTRGGQSACFSDRLVAIAMSTRR